MPMIFLNKTVVLCALAALCALVMLFVPRVAQDPTYHQFADGRTLLGIPNFWNVISNAPFAIVGIYGLITHHRVRGEHKPAFTVFCLGILLIAAGSSYYHVMPANDTLLWDRLPMTIAFMALFTAVLGDSILNRQSGKLLALLTAAGPATVVYWYVSEKTGVGDLRPYALVQFLPIFIMLPILWRRRLHTLRTNLLWWTLGFYILAKMLEHFDTAVYTALSQMGGHALKHIAAAIASWFAIHAFFPPESNQATP